MSRLKTMGTSDSLVWALLEDKPSIEEAAQDPEAKDESTLKKEGHAAYMRFYRSVTTAVSKTPPEVMGRLRELQGSGKRLPPNSLTFLFEDWSQSKENWAATALVQSMTRTMGKKKTASFKWMSRTELDKKYNDDLGTVNELVERKTKENNFKDNPDFPGACLVFVTGVCRYRKHDSAKAMCQPNQ